MAENQKPTVPLAVTEIGAPADAPVAGPPGFEARLMTVLTFWHSNGFAEARDRRIARMQQKLLPFLDQSMRVQSFTARVIDGRAALATNELAAAEPTSTIGLTPSRTSR